MVMRKVCPRTPLSHVTTGSRDSAQPLPRALSRADLSGEPEGELTGSLDLDEAVVLGDTLTARRCSALDLPTTDSHGQVGDEGIFGHSGAMGHHLRPASRSARGYGFERLCPR